MKIAFAGLLAIYSLSDKMNLCITTALGWAISEICYDCCKRMAKGEKVDFDLAFSTDSVKSLVGEYMRTHKDSVNPEE